MAKEKYRAAFNSLRLRGTHVYDVLNVFSTNLRRTMVVRFVCGASFGILFFGVFSAVLTLAVGPVDIGDETAHRPLGLEPTQPSPLPNIAATGIRVGQDAPDFTLRSPKGKYIHLKDFEGHVVILSFWLSWSLSCQQQGQEFQEVYATRKAGDTYTLLSINYKEPDAAVLTFFINRRFHYPVALDSTGAVARGYRIASFPTTYVIDRHGIVREGPLDRVLDETQIAQKAQ